MTDSCRRTATGAPSRPDTGDEPRWSAPPPGWERYEGLCFVGRGGMGSVYSAWDPRLRRSVALKFLHAADDDATRRFLAEARAQARVAHPNVCEVYEVGEVAGRPFVAMQLIAGRPLSQAVEGLTREDRLRIVRDVARAVHAAHVQGLIHRDIKPSNVMVSVDDDGRPRAKVVDFGLSRPFLSRLPADGGATGTAADTPSGGEPLDLTLRGEIAGTPAYMSPEQALGVTSRLDARADVYSIGCTLYEVLVGRPPHSADSHMELLLKVTSEEPTPPRTLDPTIAADLDALVMRCLRKDPGERYATAAELADDLDAVLQRRRVRAYSGGVRYAVHTFVRRAPAAALAAAVLVTATAVATGLWLDTTWRAARRAAAAQSFGAEVARLESLLWKERSLPVHDIRPALAGVRRRVADLEHEIARRGRDSRAPGRLAIGTALLELGDTDAALPHLEAAWRARYAPREAAWALGRALGQRYQQGLARLETIADTDLRAVERARLEREYGDRVRRLLADAEGCTAAAPEFLASLRDLYEGRTDDGLAHARASFEAAPWQYEAKLLEGDLQLARARALGPGEAADAAFAAGEEACLAAAVIAPSDPACHLELAELLWQRLLSHHPARIDMAQWQRALAATATARSIDASSFEAPLLAARLHLLDADQRRVLSLGDPAPAFEAALAEARAARAAAPARPEVLAALGEVELTVARWRLGAGLDPSQQLERALASLGEAAEIEPTYGNLNTLGVALRRSAQHELDHGRDPLPLLDRAAAAFSAATTLAPDEGFAWSNLAWVELNRAQHDARHGRDPLPGLTRSVATFRRARDTDPASFRLHNNLGMALTELAVTRAHSGGDAGAVLDEAAASFGRAIELYPDYTFAHNNLGNLLLERARLELAHGRDPGGLLAQAESELRIATGRAGYATAWFNLGLVERERARLACALGADPLPALEQARRHFRRGLELRPDSAAALVEAARVELDAARATLTADGSAATPLDRCHRLLDRALASDPELASTWAVRAEAAALAARAEPGDHRPPLAAAAAAAREAWRRDPGDRDVARAGLVAALATVQLAGTATDRFADDALAWAEETLGRARDDPELKLLVAMVRRTRAVGDASVLAEALAANPFAGHWYALELAAVDG